MRPYGTNNLRIRDDTLEGGGSVIIIRRRISNNGRITLKAEYSGVSIEGVDLYRG
ncbi:hypothetical protein PTT_09882 [Pyrenophora teres f. teres 0-1]|uniref:Uncharacterized protein n=1 Tax=Pyrenophora teres f. teres (strain 0-1) TaxID=861557 RepID=E3RMY2_PYRTT|nr:hypothetical protein PTT_09882 [Pyrenophora teres f. teres 0-1]